MSDKCKAAMLEAGAPYPCAADCPCALEIENKALRAENERYMEALKQIERRYYQEATNPSPKTIRRMAAQMRAIAYAALETKNPDAETPG